MSKIKIKAQKTCNFNNVATFQKKKKTATSELGTIPKEDFARATERSADHSGSV